MSKYKYALLLALLGITWTVSAQKYSNEFLNNGAGARPRGMGNAFTALASDATSGYWNPAGLIGLPGSMQIAAMHNEWFAGIGKYDFLSFAMTKDSSRQAFAISAIRFGIDDIPNTLSLYNDDGTINYNNVVPFSAADYAFLLSYARAIRTSKGKLSVGGNVKIVYRQIGSFANAWGFGLDLGLQYQIKKWRFGFTAKDLTNTFNAWQFHLSESEKQVLQVEGNSLPINSVELTKPSLNLGIAYQMDLGKQFGLNLEMDWIATTDGKRNTLVSSNPISLDPALGAELDYKKLVYLRAGVRQFQRDNDLDQKNYLTVEPSIGIGLKISRFHIDYAFANVGEKRDQSYSHVISLLIDLGKK